MAQSRYRGRRSSGGYTRSGYGSRRRSAGNRARSAPRRYGRTARSRAPARGGQTVRLVIEQVPASPVSRPQLGLLNTLLKTAPKAPTKAKL